MSMSQLAVNSKSIVIVELREILQTRDPFIEMMALLANPVESDCLRYGDTRFDLDLTVTGIESV